MHKSMLWKVSQQGLPLQLCTECLGFSSYSYLQSIPRLTSFTQSCRRLLANESRETWRANAHFSKVDHWCRPPCLSRAMVCFTGRCTIYFALSRLFCCSVYHWTLLRAQFGRKYLDRQKQNTSSTSERSYETEQLRRGSHTSTDGSSLYPLWRFVAVCGGAGVFQRGCLAERK